MTWLGQRGLHAHMGGMWTKEHRERSRRCPPDLTDEEWMRIEPLLPKPATRGRKRAVDLREMLDAIRYMARNGGGWRMMPVLSGLWETVYR